MSNPHVMFCLQAEAMLTQFTQIRKQYPVTHETQYIYDRFEGDVRTLRQLYRRRCRDA